MYTIWPLSGAALPVCIYTLSGYTSVNYARAAIVRLTPAVRVTGLRITLVPGMAALALFLALLVAVLLSPPCCFAAPVRHGPRAGRICRPAPPAPNGTTVPTCLVIGDSVSLGTTGAAFGAGPCEARGCCSGGCLAIDMMQECEVLHAPFSGDGGACDIRYGLECGALWLGSNLAGGSAPKYSAITFNFGLVSVVP